MRPSRLTPVSATCTALDKTADAWAAAAAAAPGRYPHDQLTGNIAGHVDGNYSGTPYGTMGAAAMTDANSGGYMLELYKFQAMHAYR